ncbi:hypothetical protein [Fibrobacter sp.]|uniref:hypothetical protein n=1 Tax=Fibrobacter sp. TaxID=35828 RepID=UPI0025B9DE6D|nr:hypothetical protein [Fibrobacter sp.]MBR3074030.1 hypothetical protein [Fibrobacter sp.]
MDSIDISCFQNDRMLFVIQPVIPDWQCTVLVIPDLQCTVLVIPDLQCSVLVIPDLQCSVLVIPDLQCSVLVIPDSVPGSPSWLAKKNVGIGPIN